MIEQLMVQDYILFEKALVQFGGGFSVITGETGAGKSLLIDAIQAISGGRISKGVVRKGKDKAVLEMVLSHPSEKVRAMLEENGFDLEDDTLVLTRIVQASGKSRMLLNNRVTTNAFVSQIVSQMVDIHSQMDTITLMDPQLQLSMLDQYAGNSDLKEETARAFKALTKTMAELRRLKKETFSDAHLEKITKQLNEIEEANVKDGELEALEEKIRSAEQAHDAAEDLATALYLWRRESGIQDQLYQAVQAVSDYPMVSDAAGKLSDLYYEAADLFEQFADARNDLGDDAQNLDKLQEREFLISNLYKKYGGDYTALMKTKEDLARQVDEILHRQDHFDALEKQKKVQLREYTQWASKLHQSRKAVVDSLKEQVETHAKDLMLEHCVFDIHFEKKNPSADGMDAVEFYASMNPGQAPTPLKQSASGGELSRLMLALKVVFQAENGIETLIFDEIDTGVSGKVALAMGSKMHKLSENYQVLCITHLPSVAVWADDHYRVVKSSDGASTKTCIEELDASTHIDELAIMASGSADEAARESMEQLSARVKHG